MFCVRGFGGGLGFLSFWGVVLACPSCFLGLLGFSVFLVRSAPACWGGGRVAGGSGVRGLARPGGSFFFFLLGAGLGCVCARPVSCFLVVGGWVRGARVARFLLCCGGGRVVPGFLFVFAVFLLVFAGVFGCCFFRPVLLVSSGSAGAWSFVGLWFPRGWGVVGGVGLGWGCFFSGFCCTGPGLFGFGLGFVWRV